MTGNVLIAAPVHPVLTDGLRELGYNCVVREDISQGIAAGLVKDCVGIVTSTRLQLDKELLDAANKLQWIGRMGSGMEVIDLEYARAKGIACYASPEGNCNAVGEHALGMLLTLVHRVAWSHAEMTRGLWQREENRGMELEGKTMGIIGCGHAGRSFAQKLQGMGMRVMAYDKYDPGGIPQGVENCSGLDPIFAAADMVSFHVPLRADTIAYFNQDFVAAMQKPFILINTSRGAVVDTAALLDGMDSGKVTGACLDVFEQEPISRMNANLQARLQEKMAQPNMIVTPHIAGYTYEALYKMSKVLLTKISIGANT